MTGDFNVNIGKVAIPIEVAIPVGLGVAAYLIHSVAWGISAFSFAVFAVAIHVKSTPSHTISKSSYSLPEIIALFALGISVVFFLIGFSDV